MSRLIGAFLWSLMFAAGADAQVAIERVSVSSAGAQGNGATDKQSLSADGRYVVFDSDSDDLVSGDNNLSMDVFLHDRETGATTRVSLDSAGGEGNDLSVFPALSGNGRYVVFDSDANDLVPGDTNGDSDVFVHDSDTGLTTRVSVSSEGDQTTGTNKFSGFSTISADGRFVAFNSPNSTLVNGDTNDTWDIFVHDRDIGVTTRVSLDSAGVESNGASFIPAISADGRYIGFYSLASNLVAGDTNGAYDIFVHDRVTSSTTRVSVDSAGGQGNGNSYLATFSADGRYVGFQSFSSNLVTGDTNGEGDAFVHDQQTGLTERVSLGSGGVQGNLASSQPFLSADGRYAAFLSEASNLVPGDGNGKQDVFVRDRQTGLIERVNITEAGLEANDTSWVPTLSSNGRYVGFLSAASNLVAGDTNGQIDSFVLDRWAHEEFVGLNTSSGDRAGSAVSVDNSTAVVGARLADHSGFANAGSATVFEQNLSTGTWSEVTSLFGFVDASAAQDKFGHSVSVSGDTIAIGAENDDDAGFRAGKVYVYGRDVGGTDNWGLVKALTGSDTETRDFFGRSLALDGDRLVVGAHVEDENGSNAGAVYVFERNEGGADNWGQTQKLLASDGAAGDRFGASVDLDDDNLVVGAFRKATAAGASAGQAYVFRATGGVWSEIRTLMPAGAVANDQFGYSVSIDGVRVAVGSRFSDSATGNQTGSVHVFAQDVGGVDNWGEVQKLEASDLTAGDRFGTAVALSSDRLAVGSPLQDDNGDKAGKAYVYKYNGTDFTEIDQLINEHVTLRDEFGIAIAIDGSSCVVGAWLDNRPSNNTGAAYVFEVL